MWCIAAHCSVSRIITLDFGKRLQVPAAVAADDWSVLADRNASADEVGSAVSRIVASVAARLTLESPTASALYDSALPGSTTTSTTAERLSSLEQAP